MIRAGVKAVLESALKLLIVLSALVGFGAILKLIENNFGSLPVYGILSAMVVGILYMDYREATKKE